MIIQVTNEYNCVDTAVKIVYIEEINSFLYIPNAFSPSSDILGIKYFLPKGNNLETYEIFIYDFWGNLLWYSNKLYNGSPCEGWDGTCDGVIMKTDSYIWKVKATLRSGEVWGEKHGEEYFRFGNLLLIR